MNARLKWMCWSVFAAGAAGGWAMSDGKILRSQGAAQNGAGQGSGQSGKVSGEAAEGQPDSIPGLPEPSGLPGDLIHLSHITDTRTLRALWASWAKSDWETSDELVRRWAALDPVDGIRFFLFELVKGEPRDPVTADWILQLWSDRDPWAVLNCPEVPLALFHLLSEQPVDRAVRQCLEKDPEKLISLWRNAPSVLRDHMYPMIFRHWFANDPARAIAEAARVPRSWQKEIWIISSMAGDPGAMLDVIKANGVADRNPYAVNQLIFKLADKDLSAAQAAIAGFLPGESRSWACAALAAKWSQSDPEAAWAWVEANAPTQQNRLQVREALLKKDPAKALAMDPGGDSWPHSTELVGYAKELAGKDWEGALELARSLGPNLRRQIFQGAAASISWEEGDPVPKLEQVGRLIAQQEPGYKMPAHFLFNGLDPGQAPAIAAWMSGQPENVREALILPMASRLREVNPATAAEWLVQLPPGEKRTEQLLESTAIWAGNEPEAAAEFSVSLPEGAERDYAILNTALAWKRNDPAAARGWLEALPDSPAKTRAMQELEAGSGKAR